MLSTRILTALVLIVLVLAALFLLPPRGFGVAVLAVMLLAGHEWANITGTSGAGALVFDAGVLVLGGNLLFGPWSGFAQGWPDGVVLAVCGVAALFWLVVAAPWVVRRWRTRSPLALAVAGWVMLVGAFVALTQLQSRSPWLLLAAMAIVWVADTAAYFCGRAFGRHKLAPEVSPGKTWEGVWGGLAAVAVYALALVPLATEAGFRGRRDAAAIALWMAAAVAVAAVSVIGDLFKSWQKRQAGVKDSGTLLPGHGGVLDRIDALLAAMPFVALGAVAFLARSA